VLFGSYKVPWQDVFKVLQGPGLKLLGEFGVIDAVSGNTDVVAFVMLKHGLDLFPVTGILMLVIALSVPGPGVMPCLSHNTLNLNYKYTFSG